MLNNRMKYLLKQPKESRKTCGKNQRVWEREQGKGKQTETWGRKIAEWHLITEICSTNLSRGQLLQATWHLISV